MQGSLGVAVNDHKKQQAATEHNRSLLVPIECVSEKAKLAFDIMRQRDILLLLLTGSLLGNAIQIVLWVAK